MTPEPESWDVDLHGTGPQIALCKQQFQLLYRYVGNFQEARRLAPELILWPKAVAPRKNLMAWALEEDRNSSKIPEEVEQAFKRRYDGYPKSLALRAVSATSALSQSYAEMGQKLTEQAKAGTVNPDLLKVVQTTSALFQHSNNATGWIYDKVLGQKGHQTILNNPRFMLNAGERPKRPKNVSRKTLKAAIPLISESGATESVAEIGQFREMDV